MWYELCLRMHSYLTHRKDYEYVDNKKAICIIINEIISHRTTKIRVAYAPMSDNI